MQNAHDSQSRKDTGEMGSFQKCYYCGGENDVSNIIDDRLQCQFCRRWISIPSKLDQEKQALYDLGKQKMELLQFEEAEKSFQTLIKKEPDNADAYWQALLCHYGVEYILDEASKQNVPTITLLTREPILEHPYYLQAIQNAGSDELRATWQEEAEHINNIMLLYEKVAAAEKGYDVFISVKQGTAQGTPTSDSFEAAKLMQFLESKGLRVFNSRFSLKDIIGQEYEPYIMAALLSAKAMIVVGSSRDYLEAKWVRNEWRRFRWLQENSEGNRVLIPFLLGISPSDVPSEMGVIQCVVNTSTSPYADILRAIRRTIPLSIPQLKRPAAVPAGLEDSEKEAWLEQVRKDLEEMEELRDCVMPDLSTARDAVAYADMISNNLKNLEGFAETYSLSREVDTLRKHFRSEYERIRLSECAVQVKEIAGQMSRKIYNYDDACAIQDELDKLQAEISGYSGHTQAESTLSKVRDLQKEIRKTVVRLNPENIITDPLRHAVAVGKDFVAGLRKDGTVLVEGKDKALVVGAESWKDIISLTAGAHHLVGLRRNGTVVAVGNNKKKQCEVTQWKDIISIVASADHTLAMDSEGKCFGAGDNAYGQLNVDGWREIVSLSTAGRITVGCDREGNVFSTGDSRLRATQLNGWTNIDRVFALDQKVAGLRSDGEVLLIGSLPQTEMRQAKELNRKRNLYRSFVSACNNSFAALTGTGDVRLIRGTSFRLWQAIVAFVLIVSAISANILGESMHYFDSHRALGFLVIGILALSMSSFFLFVFYNVFSILKKVAISVIFFRWKNVVDIASDGRGKVILGLQTDGRLASIHKASAPQWYSLGLPELEEE